MLLFRLIFGRSRQPLRTTPVVPEKLPPVQPPARTQPQEPISRSVIAPDPQDCVRGRAWVIDGDTLVINRLTIRLAGIDAPELDQPWGQKAKWELHAICKGRIVTAEFLGELSHGRQVARCTLDDGTDIGGLLVKRGLALDWAQFSGGRYRLLEPAGVRKKFWRVTRRPGHR